MKQSMLENNKEQNGGYTFIIPGKPVAKGRPRARNNGSFVTLYTPESTKDYEMLVGMCYHGPKFSDQPLKIHMEFCFEYPKSTSKKQLESEDLSLHTKKPDIDNLIKAVMDGLNDVAYDDDKYITEVSAVKKYTTEPYVKVTICQNM